MMENFFIYSLLFNLSLLPLLGNTDFEVIFIESQYPYITYNLYFVT